MILDEPYYMILDVLFLIPPPKTSPQVVVGISWQLSTSQRLLAPPTLDLWCTKCCRRRARQQRRSQVSSVGIFWGTKNGWPKYQWTRDGSKGWFLCWTVVFSFFLKHLHRHSWNCYFFVFFGRFDFCRIYNKKQASKATKKFQGFFLVEINGQQVL